MMKKKIIVIIALLIIFYDISVLAHPVFNVLGSSYHPPAEDSFSAEIISITALTIASILICIVLFWHPKPNLKEKYKRLLAEMDEDEIAELGMNKDEIAELEFDENMLKELENTSPGKVLAATLLSESEKFHAETFVIDKSGNTDEIICKYKVGEKWDELPRPPASVWSLIYNVYMIWAGLDYFKPGIQKGHIKHDELNWQWDFEVNEPHDKITFKRGKEQARKTN
jgi:hypothetical protein